MRPLEDVRVVAVEQFGAGPFGTLQLADLGAQVIKIEDPGTGGDVARYVPPFQEGEDSLFFETFNRNKLSLSLDLATTAGQEVLHRLVRASDAVYSNLRGDVPRQLGLSYEQLRQVNPRVVCVALTGFGMTGPRSEEPAYDHVIQALSGWMSLTGEPDGPPTRSGLSLVDFSGGLVAALALVTGVHAARRDGAGMDCDVSLFDTAIALQTYLATWHLSAGYEPGRTSHSAHPSIVPFQAFQTADGWIVVVCAKQKFWERLVRLCNDPGLDDERFGDFELRRLNAELLTSRLSDLFRAESTEAWTTKLIRAGIPAAPVQDITQALNDPQSVARDLIVSTEHPRWGTVRHVASPVRVGPHRIQHRRAPARNQDASQILHDICQLSATDVARLRIAGAFGGEGTRSSQDTTRAAL